MQRRTIDNFITKTVELENNYQNLLTILTDWAILSSNPTPLATFNQAFTKCLTELATFKERLEKSVTANYDLEQAWRAELAFQFVQASQENWKDLTQVIIDLSTEASNYRTEMYEQINISSAEQQWYPYKGNWLLKD